MSILSSGGAKVSAVELKLSRCNFADMHGGTKLVQRGDGSGSSFVKYYHITLMHHYLQEELKERGLARYGIQADDKKKARTAAARNGTSDVAASEHEIDSDDEASAEGSVEAQLEPKRGVAVVKTPSKHQSKRKALKKTKRVPKNQFIQDG